MNKYEYIGCFFDYNELAEKVKQIRKNPLESEKKKPHVTFEYGPSHVDTELFGTQVFVSITGYGNDGENEGVFVELLCDNEKLNNMIEKIEVPHITLAVSRGGKAVNTRFLKFEPITPIQIVGYFGGHIDN